MNQTTTCPQCQTRFRVTEEQLQAREGRVRCGRCSHVFNALEILNDPALTPSQSESSGANENPFEPQIDFDTLPAKPVEPEPEVRVIRIQPPTPAIEPKISPNYPKYGPPPKPKRAWPWVLASLILMVGLATQGVFFFRDRLAANFPPTRALFEQACAILHCRISLPRNPDLISIETSDLNADPARANIVVLSSVLRNRASHVQAYPSLEMTLTNARDEIVARQIFSPKEYLQNQAVIPQGIPAGGDVAVKLLMDLGDLKAEGYRLYLFYPS